MASRPWLWLVWLPAACFGGGGITPVQTAFNRAVYLESVGALAAAVVEYERALEEDPNDWRARFNWALALERLADAADPAPAQALRDRAEQGYRAVLEQQPGNLRAAVNLAAIEHARDPAAAKARLRQTIAQHPGQSLPRLALAAHLLRERAAAEAVEVLAPAVAQRPGGDDVNLLLGDARLALGDVAAARAAYARVLEHQPSSLGALLALGRLEHDQGAYDAARGWLERALLVDPDAVVAHELLAGGYEAASDFEAAVAHLWHVRRLQPDRASEFGPRLVALYERLAALERRQQEP